MQGPLSQRMISEAQAMHESIFSEPETEWPLITSSGEITALIELVSEDQVSCKVPLESYSRTKLGRIKICIAVDVSGPAIHRPKLEGNSKRVGKED